MTKRFVHFSSVVSAGAVCVALLLCSKYENKNPVSSDYQGDYRLRVAWKSLPSPMEMNRDYAVSCTTGSDAFVSVLPVDSQRRYLDTIMLSSAIKSGTLTFRFVKEFRDTLVLVGLRPNSKEVRDGSFLTVENMLKPRLSFADPSFAVGHGTNSIIINVQDSSGIVRKLYWRFKQETEADSLPNASNGPAKINVFVPADLYYDTLMIWGVNDRGYVSDTLKTALTVKGFSPDLDSIAWHGPLRCGDTLAFTVFLADTPASKFRVLASGTRSRYSDTSILYTYYEMVDVRMTKPLVDTGLVRLQVQLADSAGIRSRMIIDSLFVHYTLPFLRFADTRDTMQVTRNDTAEIQVSDSTATAVTYTWQVDGQGVLQATDSDRLKLFIGDSVMTIRAFGTNVFGYSGDTVTKVLVPQPFSYRLGPVPGAFPDTIVARHEASWAVVLDSAAKLLQFGGRYYWQIITGKDTSRQNGPALISVAKTLTDSTLLQIKVAAQDTFGGSSNELSRFVTVRTFRPNFRFLKRADTTRIGTSLPVAAHLFDSNPLGGAIDSVFWDKNADGSIDIVNTDSSLTVVYPYAGSYTIAGWARDIDGFLSDPDTIRILVKADYPYFISRTDTSTYTDVPCTLRVAAHPGESGVPINKYYWYIAEDNKRDSTVAPSYVYVFTRALTYTVIASCKDTGNITSAKPDTFRVTADPGVPVISSVTIDTAETAIFINDPRFFRISASDRNGLVIKLYVSWNGDTIARDSVAVNGKNVLDSISHSFQNADAGLKSVKLWAVDNSGLRSAIFTKQITVRLGRPKMLSITKDSTIVYARDPVNYTLSAVDTNGTIRDWYLAWDAIDGFRQVIGGKVTTTFISAGTRNVRAYAVDDDGIVSDTLTWQLVVHSGAPVVDSLYPKAVWVNDDTTFSIFNHDTNGTVDSLFFNWGDATPDVKFKTGDVIRHKYSVSKAGVDTVKVTAKDNDGVLSNVFKYPVAVHLGMPKVDSIKIDTTGNNVFIKDLRTYRVYAHDTNGSIKTIYAAWNNGTSADTSIPVNIAGSGFGLIAYRYDISLSGPRTARFWVRDDDTIMSSSKDTTILVRLAPPVLWGDNPTKDTVWTIINNGYGINYNVHINSFDTNGTISRYYWSEAGSFDSTTATKTNDSLYSRLIGINDVNHAFPIWIYGRDNDGLVRGRQFTAFADSAPPAPVVTFSISAGGGIINWRGKDTKDGNLTQYEILLKKGTTDPVEPTNIISQYNAGSNYSAATVGGFDFSYSFITQGTGEYHCQVIAKDARGTISKSTVVISAY